MAEKRVVYLCKIKLLGFPFVVETRELAEQWISESPDTRYFDEVEVRDSV